MKASEIKQVSSALVQLAQQKLPFKLSYRVSKLIKKFNEEANAINETLVSIIKENGGVEEGNGNYQIVAPDKEKATEEEIKEYEKNVSSFSIAADDFMKEEILINFDPIDIGLFPEDLSIEAGVLTMLEPILANEKPQ